VRYLCRPVTEVYVDQEPVEERDIETEPDLGGDMSGEDRPRDRDRDRDRGDRDRDRDRDRRGSKDRSVYFRPVEVEVKDNLEKAMRALKNRMSKEGVLQELKRRRFYEKPSVRRKRKEREALKRLRRAARRALSK
jgi:small subunit ribosomal protein S21